MADAQTPVMDEGLMKRTVLLLAGSLSLAHMGTGIVMIVTAVTGKMLMPEGGLPTLPLTLQFVGTMMATIPANMIMRKIGRKRGFIIGQMIGIAGAMLSVYAILELNFSLFCLGGFILGINNAVWFYYRFAAAEAASDDYRPKAISYVMAGGIVAAVFGAELAKLSQDWLVPGSYAGCYLIIAILCLVIIAILQFIDVPELSEEDKKDSGRPLTEIISQPLFICAVVAAMMGYGMMSLVMTSTPLAMEYCGFEFDDRAFVIQWHILAMFAPSLITGGLIKRYGAISIISIGLACISAAVAIHLSGIEFLNFISGLILLGLGWNFMFVGGTSLLTESYRNSERNKVQGLNDFLVFGTVSITSLSAGWLQEAIGWEAVNIAVIPAIVLSAFALMWAAKSHKRQQVAV